MSPADAAAIVGLCAAIWLGLTLLQVAFALAWNARKRRG